MRAYDSSGTLVDTLSATTCDCTPEGVSDAESPGYDAIGIIGSVVYANRGFTGKSVAWDVSSGSRRPVDGPLEPSMPPGGPRSSPWRRRRARPDVQGAAGPRLRPDDLATLRAAGLPLLLDERGLPARHRRDGRPRRIAAEPGPHLPLRRAGRRPHERRRDRARRIGRRHDRQRLTGHLPDGLGRPGDGAGPWCDRQRAACRCARSTGGARWSHPSTSVTTQTSPKERPLLPGRRTDRSSADVAQSSARVRSKREWIASGRCGSWIVTSRPASSHTTE